MIREAVCVAKCRLIILRTRDVNYFKTVSLLPLLMIAALLALNVFAVKANAAQTLTVETAVTTTPLPAEGSCAEVQFPNPSMLKWPLLLVLCHYSAAEFNALKSQPALDNHWLPEKEHYQGLADNLLDYRLPSIALAHGQRWFQLLAAEIKSNTAVVQLTEIVSPYSGCKLLFTENGLTDPCVGANWDKLGRLLAPVSDYPPQSLRQFPFKILNNEVVLAEADDALNWQLQSFVPDLQDSSVPLVERIGKGLFWGMLDEVKALWPELVAAGPLTGSEQVDLFMMALARERSTAIVWLVEQGLNPMARDTKGYNAIEVAELLENEAMVQLLTELAR